MDLPENNETLRINLQKNREFVNPPKIKNQEIDRLAMVPTTKTEEMIVTYFNLVSIAC